MLDGIIVSYGMVASVPLAWIKRIEILKSGGIATSLTMNLENNGVVSVITKPVDDRKNQEKPIFHSVNKIIKGYDVPRIFYSPDHSSGSDSQKMPDLRSTLFWEPDITVTNNEDFYLNYFNSDNSGTVKIIVEGITSTGIPVTGKVEYVIE